MQFEHKDLQIVAATRHPENLPADYRGEVRVGDLRDADYLDRMLAGVNIICHAAGWSHYTNNDLAARNYYLEPTIDLINRAKEWRISRFVNLSSIAVSPYSTRMIDESPGKPRRGCTLYNCMIAVEDYLKSITNTQMSTINCRLGIYSGQQMNLGLLPLLIQRPSLPLFSGNYGHLPLVDGRDIGQAFARAALLPDINGYNSVNILGAELPQQKTVLDYMQQQLKNHTKKTTALPMLLALPLHALIRAFSFKSKTPLATCAITAALVNPLMENTKAKQLLGYQPQFGWQASVDDLIVAMNKNPGVAELFIKEKGYNE